MCCLWSKTCSSKERVCLQNANVGGYTARGFVEVLAASQRTESKAWFQGTADAVRQYLWLFDAAIRDGVEDFLILSGEQQGSASTFTHNVLSGCSLLPSGIFHERDVQLHSCIMRKLLIKLMLIHP